MAHKDVGNKRSASGCWRMRVRCILLIGCVLSTCLAIRIFEAPQRAEAQGPQAQPGRRAADTRGAPPKTARPGAPAQKPTPSVMAVVNGASITRQELADKCLRRWGEEVLESLVNKHLILQACKDQGITITQQDVNDEIVRISEKFGLSAEHWLKMLQTERDITAEQYRRDIVWPTLALRRLAADQLEVTQDELAREFESEYGAKVQVRMISVTSPSKAEAVLAQARANAKDFPNLAKEHSEDPNSASARGLIPPVSRYVGEPAIEKAVFALQPGEISPIVHAANQYLIFKCEKHLPPADISPQYRQVAEDRLRERIVERNLRVAAADLFKRLQDQAKIVNIYNDPQLRQQSPGMAASVNGTQISLRDLAEECVVRHGRERLDSEIHLKLLAQALQRKNLKITESQIDQEIARAAEAYGFLKKDGAPDVDSWLKEVTTQEGIRVDQYIRDAVWPTVALKQIVGDHVQVTEEDLLKGFQANYGERVEILAIVLGNQRTAQEVWDMARKNPTRKFFGELAERYSIEPVSRANYGEVPPIRHHGGQPQIEQEAFRLKPDELSGIVAMGDKFIIMKCLGRTEPFVGSMADVRDELVKDIKEKKLRLAMSEQFDQLKESAQIDNFLTGTSQSGRPTGGQPTNRTKPSADAPRAKLNSAVRPVVIDPRQRR